jgi:cytidine deaminase
MKYLTLNEKDQELIEAAKSVIRKNFVPDRHQVGAAIRTKSGRIYSGVHLESPGIDICAEPVALGMAISNGEREFDSIVAVGMGDGKEPYVLSPCGICRELIVNYGKDISVIFVENGDIKKCKASELLPGPYRHQ